MKTETQKTPETNPVAEYVVNTVKLNDSTKIKFVENPKRQKSAAHNRYSKYGKAKTFGEYLKLNEGKFSMADARYDLSHGFLTVE
jgi:hypothetical protein